MESIVLEVMQIKNDPRFLAVVLRGVVVVQPFSIKIITEAKGFATT